MGIAFFIFLFVLVVCSIRFHTCWKASKRQDGNVEFLGVPIYGTAVCILAFVEIILGMIWLVEWLVKLFK